MPQSTRNLLILAAAGLGALGYFVARKYQEEQDKPWVWGEFTSSPVPYRTDAPFGPGSCAVHVYKKTKFSVYLIDNGEKTLKDSFVLDPAYIDELFITAVQMEPDAGSVFFKPTMDRGRIREGTPEEMRRQRWVNFPKPYRMTFSPGYAADFVLGKSGERILFFAYLEETPEARSIPKEQIEAMIDESKKQSAMSYLVITCSAG